MNINIGGESIVIMKKSENINHYKEKVIELADKLLEKDKRIKELEESSKCLEKFCDSLAGQCNCCKSRLANNYQKHIDQADSKITSLIKERDNYKSDYEYAEKCFQSERELRYKLEDEIKVLRGKKTYPCISLECNDVTGESSSLYFCFSYDEKVLLANNVPKYVDKDKFILKCYIDSTTSYGLTYVIEYLHPAFYGNKLPLNTCDVNFEVSYDLKELVKCTVPNEWMNYCNNKSNKNTAITPKYHLSNYKIRIEVVDSVYHYIYLVDEKEGRRLNFACICDWSSNISVNDFQMIDTFMESDDILQIQRKIKYTTDYKHYYIDLKSFKHYATELELRKSREGNI